MKTNTYKLKELLSIKNGKDYRHLKSGDIPVYGTGGITAYVNEYLYDGESILLPRKGTLDNISYIQGKFWTIDTMYWSIVNEQIAYPKYLYLYLTLLDLSCRDSGSTLPSMTFDAYYSLDIQLPSLAEQKQIADVIFRLNLKIENNNKITTELESLAKTIYEYWFVQFDFPDENGKPYKKSGGKMVYNEEIKREIPEGWKVENLNDMSEQINGYPFSSENYVEDGNYKLYTIKNVQDSEIISEVDNYIDIIPQKMNKECLLSPHDMIMSLTGNVGRVGLVFEDNALLNQRVLKLKEKDVPKEFLYLLLKNESVRLQIEKMATGTSQKNLSPIELGKLKIICPPKEVLNNFEKKCNGHIKTIVNNKKENQKLAELRDFLLPLLMNGQVGFKK